MEMIHIVWTDAVTSSEAGWTTKEEAMATATSSPPKMETIGFVLHENKEWISLTDSVGGDEFGQITKIPKSMIIDLKYLVKEDRRHEENDGINYIHFK